MQGERPVIMKSSALGYLLFSVVLIVLTLVLGSRFYLAEILVVLISTICVLKFVKNMSLLVTSAIVIVVTIVFPLLVLMKMSEGSGLYLRDYLLPTDTQSTKTFINFLLPFLTFIVAAKILRGVVGSDINKHAKQKRGRK